MNIKSSRPLVLTITLSSLLGFGAAMLAPEAQASAPTETVSYRDLDLSQPADARRLYQRLQHAAGNVCNPLVGEELARLMIWRRCYDAALDHAVEQINAPQLLALHRAQIAATGRG
jgi:UrcA family protein